MDKKIIVERVKILSQEENEEIVLAYLDIAKEKILAKAFPFKDTSFMEVPSKYHSIWIDATIFLLNKRGAEGQSYHLENGIERTWKTGDLPAEILKSITPFCGVFEKEEPLCGGNYEKFK